MSLRFTWLGWDATGCFKEELKCFVRSPDDQTGISGGVVSFVCQAMGEPRPRITWTKKGKKVSSQRFEVKEFDGGCGSVLRIQPLRTNRDEAIYECTATNSLAEVTATAKLNVLEEDQIPHGFPTIDMGPQLKVVERTTTATMLCAASGNPDPEIHWFKDMLPVDISSNSGRIKQLRSGALQIENSNMSDEGKYECVAVNSAGTRFSSPANLYVRVRRVPPRFSIPPTNHEVMPGGSVNLTCVAVGSPMPFVKWVSGEVGLSQENHLPVGRNVLELTNIHQSANYTCVAMSDLGVIEATAQVTVKALPKMPHFLGVVETTATSVTLNWESGNAEPVSYYLVQYRPKLSDNGFQEVDGVASTRYSIGGLSPFSEYEFRVLAVNSIGRGPPSSVVETRTGEQAPSSAPLHVQARLLSSSNILVQWEPPEEPNGQIQGYRIYYSSEPSEQSSTWKIHNTDESRFTTISGLTPGLTYSLKMLGFTAVGDGPLSDVLQIKTQQGGENMLIYAIPSQGSSKILNTPEVRASSQLLIGSWSRGHRVTFNAAGSYAVDGLKPDTVYLFSLAARSERGLGLFTQPAEARTTQSTFTKNFGVKAVMKTSVLLTWDLPETYKSQVPLKILYNHQSVEVQGHLMRKLITQLQPDTDYSFILMSRGNGAGGLQQQVSIRTAPDLLIVKPTRYQLSEEEDRVMILLPQVPAEARVRSVWFYIVTVLWFHSESLCSFLMSSHQLMLEAEADSHLQRQSPDLPQSYIAAKLDSLPEIFALGDDKKYHGYYNRALPVQKLYRCFVLAELNDQESVFSASPFSESFMLKFSGVTSRAQEDPEMLWVMGPVLAVIIIIITDSCSLCLCEPVLISLTSPGMKEHPPIFVSNLADHIERLKANSGLRFSQEYQSIDPGQQFTWENSIQEVNKPKNRYANVIAYDHSRIILTSVDGVPASTYINANYIDGYRKQNAYIATQGPLPETLCDFWRMVWEQRTCTIVMMTHLEEKSRIKCEQYWPSRGTETYGMIQVTILDTVELATYVMRTFTFYKNGSSEKREVLQFQFLGWPDHGVPEYPTTTLAFLQKVRACNPPDAGPIIVHCSAGVGRTGCFIVIDAMLERMKHEKSVDIYGHVTCMRAQRNYMVQTEDQYIFIHEALLEAATCGCTEVTTRNLYTHIQKLNQSAAGETLTPMAQEFKVRTCSNFKAQNMRFISANLPCNKFKNRLINILPFEFTRVCLKPIRGVEGSDYINASFINGYRHQGAYIATQGPLAETSEDFWRMLWEHNSTIVVMLTKLREMGREKCHQYWPAECSARYQYFVVDPMAEYNMPQYILREFKVTDARDGQSRTIRQFQFTDWPEQGVPKTGEAFIDFIGQVHKTKEQFGQDGPITVHCSAGVGRTGVFITLSIVLERMRHEGVVDVFQTVKILRTQRPAMVQTEDQYQLCYRAALEYLGSFDHYAT
uniref:Receptor-type tyrosine-protein phosphatase F n=1 Tax=Nothobranchius furzeri TaxID=105023 RepID=A0A8C6PJ56_NOTFU